MGRKPNPRPQAEACRHPPSRELWKFALAVLQEIRGGTARAGDLAAIAGIAVYYSTRWRDGQMYVDRAEHLVRLAAALGVSMEILLAIATGAITADVALQAGREDADPSNDQGRVSDQDSADGFKIEWLGHPPAKRRRPAGDLLVLVIADVSQEVRQMIDRLLKKTSKGTGTIVNSVVVGMAIAERFRPDVTLFDMDSAPFIAGPACRELSRLVTPAHRRNRIVVGSSSLTDALSIAARAAGAAVAVSLPFSESLLAAELRALDAHAEPQDTRSSRAQLTR